MKKLSEIKYKLITLLISFGVYSAIVFLLANNSKRGIDSSIITTYILMVIPVIILVLSLFIGNSNKVPGAINAVNASSSVSLYYAAVIFVYTTILYFFNYSKFMVGIIVVYLFISAIFVILYVYSFKQKELINQNPNKIPDLFDLKGLTNYLNSIKEKITEPRTLGLMEQLIETSLNMQDGEITDEIKQLDKSIIEYA